MKKYLLIQLFTCSIACHTYAQNINPGGVRSPFIWLKSQQDEKGTCFYDCKRNNAKFYSTGKKGGAIGDFNYNPSINLDGANEFSFDVGTVHSVSLFTIYKPADTTRENCIWHINDGKRSSLVLTTNRAADLQAIKYMNFIDINKNNPKLNMYVQQKNVLGTQPNVSRWVVGSRPLESSIPVSPFKGLVPEVIGFNRVLTNKERIRVASYLAIKYGVTLTEPTALYYNSQGSILWNGIDYPAYHNNIAGIARDDSSGLLQLTSTSGNTPGLFTMGTKMFLQNYSSIIWGENGLPFTIPDTMEAGQSTILQKKWMLIATLQDSVYTDIAVNTRQMDAGAGAAPTYWLAADHSGKGDFKLAETGYFKADNVDENGIAYFKNILWQKSFPKTVAGFIAGKNILLIKELTQPSCSPARDGSIAVKLFGGVAPYQLSVTGNGNTNFIYSDVMDQNLPLVVGQLPAGKYILSVSDASKNIYSDSFYLNNSDAPYPAALKQLYKLTPGESIEIDASKNMTGHLSYHWTGPGYSLYDAKAIIDKPGIYTIVTSKNGCESKKDIRVMEPPSDIFKNIWIFPNPSKGNFLAKVELYDKANVDLAIYTIDGRMIKTLQKKGFANYTFSDVLQTNGVYLLVFRSGSFEATRKLVIAK